MSYLDILRLSLESQKIIIGIDDQNLSGSGTAVKKVSVRNVNHVVVVVVDVHVRQKEKGR